MGVITEAAASAAFAISSEDAMAVDVDDDKISDDVKNAAHDHDSLSFIFDTPKTRCLLCGGLLLNEGSIVFYKDLYNKREISVALHAQCSRRFAAHLYKDADIAEKRLASIQFNALAHNNLANKIKGGFAD